MESCPYCAESKNLQVCLLDLELGYVMFCFTCYATGPQKPSQEEALEAWLGRMDNLEIEELYAN